MKLGALLLAVSAVNAVSVTKDPSKFRGSLNSVQNGIVRHGLNITLASSSSNKRRQSFLANYVDELYTTTATIAGQTFKFDLDTGSSDVWVRGAACTSTDGSCGVTGQDTFKTTTAATDSGKTWTTIYGSGSVSGEIFAGSVTLDGVSGSINFGVSTHERGFTSPSDGLWGLAFSTINEITGGNFVAGAQISSFAFYLSNWINGDAGELTINGVDSSKFTGTLEYIDISSDTYYAFNPTGGAFTVNGVSTALTNTNLLAIADTGTTLLYAPTTVAAAVNKAIGAPTYNAETGTYPIACSVLNTGPAVTFTLGTVSIDIGPHEYVISELDGTCFSGITSIGSVTGSTVAYIFGDTFLRAAYTVFDVTNNKLGFAQAVHPTTVVNNISATLASLIAATATPTATAAAATTTTIPTTTTAVATTATTAAVATTATTAAVATTATTAAVATTATTAAVTTTTITTTATAVVSTATVAFAASSTTTAAVAVSTTTTAAVNTTTTSAATATATTKKHHTRSKKGHHK